MDGWVEGKLGTLILLSFGVDRGPSNTVVSFGMSVEHFVHFWIDG